MDNLENNLLRVFENDGNYEEFEFANELFLESGEMLDARQQRLGELDAFLDTCGDEAEKYRLF